MLTKRWAGTDTPSSSMGMEVAVPTSHAAPIAANVHPRSGEEAQRRWCHRASERAATTAVGARIAREANRVSRHPVRSRDQRPSRRSAVSADVSSGSPGADRATSNPSATIPAAPIRTPTNRIGPPRSSARCLRCQSTMPTIPTSRSPASMTPNTGWASAATPSRIDAATNGVRRDPPSPSLRQARPARNSAAKASVASNPIASWDANVPQRTATSTKRARLGPSTESESPAAASPTAVARTGPIASTIASAGSRRTAESVASDATVAGRDPVPNTRRPSVPARRVHQMYAWASDHAGTRMPLIGNNRT